MGEYKGLRFYLTSYNIQSPISLSSSTDKSPASQERVFPDSHWCCDFTCLKTGLIFSILRSYSCVPSADGTSI